MISIRFMHSAFLYYPCHAVLVAFPACSVVACIFPFVSLYTTIVSVPRFRKCFIKSLFRSLGTFDFFYHACKRTNRFSQYSIFFIFLKIFDKL